MTLIQPLALATLEAAARAIYDADPQLGPNGPVPWDQQHTPLRAVCIAQARAAIEAIRTPSQAMIRAGGAEGYAYPGGATDFAAVWTAMIDTLLADP